MVATFEGIAFSFDVINERCFAGSTLRVTVVLAAIAFGSANANWDAIRMGSINFFILFSFSNRARGYTTIDDRAF